MQVHWFIAGVRGGNGGNGLPQYGGIGGTGGNVIVKVSDKVCTLYLADASDRNRIV